MRPLGLFLACLTIATAARRLPAEVPPPAALSADEAYRLVVVLRCSKSPQFSQFFQDRLRRQVADHLATYFGPLANVEVELYDALRARHTAAGPSEGDTLAAGLPAALARLGDDDLASFTPAAFIEHRVVEQVLLLEFNRAADGYQIHWRRWDGSTQQLGTVHETSTSDRQLLGKAACLAICEGFSPVATIAESGDRVELAFQGAKWREELLETLQLPCVMQAVRVEKRRDGSLAHDEIPYTVVVVEKGKKGLEFHPYSNRANPWQRGARFVRFEAIKIAPTRGRLTLRILDEQLRDPLSSCTVYANDRGFAQMTDEDSLGSPDRNGYVTSNGSFQRLAFVKITQGRSTEILLPLVINAASVEKTLLIPRDRAAGRKAEFERGMHALQQELGFLHSFHALGVEEINHLTQEKRYEEALERAQALVRNLREMSARPQRLSTQLRKDAEELKIDAPKRFSNANEALQSLETNVQTVDKLTANLTGIIKLNDQRSRASVAVDLGKASEQSGDFDEAIANYEQALQELPDQPKVAHRLEQLKQAWKIKSPEHQKARKFVYETWAELDLSRLADVLPQAQAAIETLISVDDYLTAQKLIVTNNGLVDELVGVASLLESSDEADDVAEMKKVKESIEHLAELSKQLEKIQQPEPVDADPAVPSPPAENVPAETSEQ